MKTSESKILPFKPPRTITEDQGMMLDLVYGCGLTIREVAFVLTTAAKEKTESGGVPSHLRSVQARKPRVAGSGHGLRVWSAD